MSQQDLIMCLADAYAEAKLYRTKNPEERAALLSAIEEVVRDAGRYRFWRNRYPETFKPTDMTPEDVDRATDSAMKEQA